MQRLRINFDRREQLKYLSHLDLLRLFERAFRRARIELSYSEGFNPHPRISLASPLSVGATSQGEIMDIFLQRSESPSYLINRMKSQLPLGLLITDVQSVSLDEPSLQSRVRFAEYTVEFETNILNNEIQERIKALLTAAEIPWHHKRDTGDKHYDLRSLVDNIWFINAHDALFTIGMRLVSSTKGAGRPEQVLKAMRIVYTLLKIHRTKLIFN